MFYIINITETLIYLPNFTYSRAITIERCAGVRVCESVIEYLSNEHANAIINHQKQYTNNNNNNNNYYVTSEVVYVTAYSALSPMLSHVYAIRVLNIVRLVTCPNISLDHSIGGVASTITTTASINNIHYILARDSCYVITWEVSRVTCYNVIGALVIMYINLIRGITRRDGQHEMYIYIYILIKCTFILMSITIDIRTK